VLVVGVRRRAVWQVAVDRLQVVVVGIESVVGVLRESRSLGGTDWCLYGNQASALIRS